MHVATTFDRGATLRAIDTVAERLISMVLAAPDLSRRVPATPEWTVAEAFAHLVTVAPRYHEGAQQSGEWVAEVPGLAELNRRQIAGLGVPDVRELADKLRSDLAKLAAVVTGFGDRQPLFTFHGGGKIASDKALGILLGEIVVHGHDIAMALGQPWPIDPEHVELIMQGLAPILPGWLDPKTSAGRTARYELRLRGQGVHRFAFANGRLRMNPQTWSGPQVVMWCDPATALLLVYRRRSQWPAIATGRVVAWGRRPWLALDFLKLFYRP
jgi:hypothetical protein